MARRTDNDPQLAVRVRAAFEQQFGPERMEIMAPGTASENFPGFPDAFEAP